MQASAQAQPNIALVKYWGKRDLEKNLPAVGSLSVTLDSLWTRTHVSFEKSLTQDVFVLNGQPAPRQQARVTAVLDRLRACAGVRLYAQVSSENNFPTAAGLASSASGFAALVCAAAAALTLDLPLSELATEARVASGSAARSMFGGFSQILPGTEKDGSDCIARQVALAAHWPLAVIVAITDESPKSVGSTEGMTRTAQTSPYYKAWVESAAADLAAAQTAVLDRDFQMLADLSEHSCLKMHGLMMSSMPPLLYWNAATVACIEAVRNLRESGVPVFFTIDAGPQVKAVCLPEAAGRVAAQLEKIPGVKKVLRSGLGEGARKINLAVIGNAA